MAATELAADAVAKALEAVAEGRSPPASPMTMNPLHIEEGGTSGSVSERVSRRLRGVSVEDLVDPGDEGASEGARGDTEPSRAGPAFLAPGRAGERGAPFG